MQPGRLEVENTEADCKPGSVVKGHLSGRLVAQPLEQLTRGIGRESLITLCLALLRMGFASVPGVASRDGELLPHHFTFTHRRREPTRWAVCSL